LGITAFPCKTLLRSFCFFLCCGAWGLLLSRAKLCFARFAFFLCCGCWGLLRDPFWGRLQNKISLLLSAPLQAAGFFVPALAQFCASLALARACTKKPNFALQN